MIRLLARLLAAAVTRYGDSSLSRYRRCRCPWCDTYRKHTPLCICTSRRELRDAYCEAAGRIKATEETARQSVSAWAAHYAVEKEANRRLRHENNKLRAEKHPSNIYNPKRPRWRSTPDKAGWWWRIQDGRLFMAYVTGIDIGKSYLRQSLWSGPIPEPNASVSAAAATISPDTHTMNNPDTTLTPGSRRSAEEARYAAAWTVHTPSGPTDACEAHADKLQWLMQFMGAYANRTLAPKGAQCANCINEARRHNAPGAGARENNEPNETHTQFQQAEGL